MLSIYSSNRKHILGAARLVGQPLINLKLTHREHETMTDWSFMTNLFLSIFLSFICKNQFPCTVLGLRKTRMEIRTWPFDPAPPCIFYEHVFISWMNAQIIKTIWPFWKFPHGGLLHCRLRERTPPPHVREQEPNFDQALQFPSWPWGCWLDFQIQWPLKHHCGKKGIWPENKKSSTEAPKQLKAAILKVLGIQWYNTIKCMFTTFKQLFYYYSKFVKFTETRQSRPEVKV